MKEEPMRYLYRYDVRRVSVVRDAERELYGSRLEFKLYYHPIVSETPKGVWIGYIALPTEKWKWVSNTARKRFAYPTKEEALDAYIARKEAYVKHAQKRLDRANQELFIGVEKLNNLFWAEMKG